MINLPKLESIIVVVFILLLFFMLFFTENSRRNERVRFEREMKEITQEKKELKHKSDSLDFLSRTLAKHYKDVYKAYLDKDAELVKITKQRDALRKARPISYTDHQIDSILTTWYPK
jgi:uncharacterized membrane-anchored protein YhcB (DUF1043 family)